MDFNKQISSFYKRKIDGAVVVREDDFFLYRKKFNKNFVVFCTKEQQKSISLSKKFPGFNILSFSNPSQIVASEINEVAVSPFAKKIVYIFDDCFLGEIPDFCYDAGVVVLSNDKIFLKMNEFEEKELHFGKLLISNSFHYMINILALNFRKVVEGRLDAKDIVKNIEKREYFRKPRDHELIMISGKKVETAEFCSRHSIQTPKVILTKLNGKVLRDNGIQNYSSFVIKDNSGCSAQGVHVIQKNNERYHDLLAKSEAPLTISEVQGVVDSYSSCIVEEKLGEDGVIPYDLKVYCYGGSPKVVLLIDRNYKKINGKVYVKAFNFKDYSFVDEFIINEQDRFFDPPKDIADSYKTFLDKNIIAQIEQFCELALKKIGYREFVSLDLFEHKGSLYLGEFTKTPGAFLYHLNKSDVIGWIFSK